MKPHEIFMQRCLELAQNGLGSTAPNPLVGALILHDNQVIGEGFHRRAGGPHAEVEAVKSVKDKSRLKGSTLYVNLEPCNHHGKTPPCTELILNSGIRQVVIGQEDPNPLVSGKGISTLRDQGVEVVRDVLLKESLDLNRRFNTFHQKKRPYIILKWAQTRDGYIDLRREPGQVANPAWITDEYCRMLVHKWRSEESAVLVGAHTAGMDNPRLNVRSWTGRDPLRLVVDRTGSLPPGLHVFDGSQPTLVFTKNPRGNSTNLEYIPLESEEDDPQPVLNILYDRQIQSLLIEGGSKLLSSFIQSNLWDEARVFTGPGTFGRGVPAPSFSCQPLSEQKTGNSRLEIFRNTKY